MKYKSILKWLIPIMGMLALVAAGAGLFDRTTGEAYPFTNHRGEETMIYEQGLYYYDTVSSAAQIQGNDLVTLIVGLSLLALSTFQAFRGSFRKNWIIWLVGLRASPQPKDTVPPS